MTPKIKKIIIILVIVVLAFVAYQYFFTKDAPAPTTALSSSKTTTTATTAPKTTTTTASGVATDTTSTKKDTQFLSTLLNISKIKVDATIFASPAFNSLDDNNVQIRNEEAVGRTNPFAPLEGAQGTINTNTSTDKILGQVTPFTTN